MLAEGFDVSVNPMGVLYNPATIARVVRRALDGRRYEISDLYEYQGIWHCLDFASKRQDADPEKLQAHLNADFKTFSEQLRRASTWVITFGTAWVFDHLPTGHIAGNCHKLPASQFHRRRLSVDEILACWRPLLTPDRRVIFTVSPVRHLADGLDGNAVSKAILRLAVDAMTDVAEYFPAFEIMIDELRDYRFYAADMKHPSQVAVDYIYTRWADTYYTNETRQLAADLHRQYLRIQHRPILNYDSADL